MSGDRPHSLAISANGADHDVGGGGKVIGTACAEASSRTSSQQFIKPIRQPGSPIDSTYPNGLGFPPQSSL